MSRLFSVEGSNSWNDPVSCVPGKKICLSINGDSSLSMSDIQVGSVWRHEEASILSPLIYAAQKPRHFLVYPKSWDGEGVSWESVSTQPDKAGGCTT